MHSALALPALQGEWFELTPVQARLWVWDQAHPELVLANECISFTLRGTLDASALEESFAELCRRHETLRTSVHLRDGSPRALVCEDAAFELDRRDLRSMERGERERRLAALVSEEHARPFDLTRAPLLRATLARSADDEHLLIVVCHHVIADGVSLLRVLPDELWRAYDARCKGRSSPLRELRTRFAQFARAEIGEHCGSKLEEHLAFWRAHLRGAPQTLELPGDAARGNARSWRGGRVHARLERRGEDDPFERVAESHAARRFDVFCAAFAALLSRYSSQSDLLIGSPVANRAREEVAEVFGCLINNVVLRVDLSGDPAFSELVRRVYRERRSTREHQALCFGHLIDAVSQDRSGARPPLYQVMFNYLNFDLRCPSLPGLEIAPRREAPLGSVVDLMLEVTEGSHGDELTLEYSEELFEPETARRILAHYRNVLAHVAAEPETRLSALELIGTEERRALLLRGRGAVLEVPRSRTLLDELLPVASACTEHPALRHGERTLCYGELYARALRLGQYLSRSGVRPRDVVGLLLHDPLEQVVAILGILASGAAYLPLRASAPCERLRAVLTEVSPHTLIANGATRAEASRVCAGSPARLVDLDEIGADLERLPAELAPLERTPEDPAYLLPTSGSTGTPRVVIVRHRNVVHQLSARRATYGDALHPERFLMLYSFAFDASVAGLFWTLAEGGMLVLADELARGDARQVRALVRRHAVTHLDVVPSLYAAILQDFAPGDLDSVRMVIVGGESLGRALAERHRSLLPGARLFNEYGPTETTVYSTVHEVDGSVLPERIPIGKPIANTWVYVLDERGALVPSGHPGELYIAGAGVAEGYFGREQLTRERFVADPFRPGGTMYKSGDRVRFRSDGALEFLGRTDRQVKLRGWRIELDEIQAVLLAHAALRDAAVVLRDAAASGGGDPRIVAYVVAEDERTGPSELRLFLRDRLPEPMIPSAFVCLPALPLTPNGKLDTAALPEPPLFDASAERTAPRDALEARILAIFEEALQRRPLGIFESFFDAGGHSLLAVDVASRIEKTLGLSLPLATFFRHPSVAGIAAHLGERRGASALRALEAVQPNGSAMPLFFVGSMHYARALGARLTRPLYGFNFFGLCEPEAPAPTLESVAQRYVEEIRSVQASGPYMLCGYCLEGRVAYRMAQLLREGGEEVGFLGVIDTVLSPYRTRLSVLFGNFRRFGPTYLARRLRRRLAATRYRRWRHSLERAQQSQGSEALGLRERHSLLLSQFWDDVLRQRLAPHDGRISLFVASEWGITDCPALRALVGGRLEVEQVAGFHDTMFEAPQVDRFAAALVATMERCSAPSSHR